MTTAPDELDDLVKRLILEHGIATIDELGVRPTLWLAAPPLWTRTVAETTGFPVESETVTEWVRRACQVGWCKTRGSLRPDGPTELRFWMPEEVRGDVLDAVLTRFGGDLSAVQHDAQEVAKSVAKSAGRVPLPGALQTWAELCTKVAQDKIPASLVERVRQAVDGDDLSHAQELVNAGRALKPVLAGPAEAALSRARLILERGLNQRTNEWALSRYLDRPELSGAAVRLLDPRASQWAVHLRGVGGVGKTTFIRYLMSGKYAEDQGLGRIPMACVNFDHMGPDYSIRTPVRLLQELADGLAPHAAESHQAGQALKAFGGHVEHAYQSVSSLRDGSASPLETPEVRRVVDAFAGVVNELGGTVLLILDTCEELAKWDRGSPDSPAIRATLHTMEAVQERAGSVRVLFAGRRPLPERDYLAVQNVAGFTVWEARRYLTEFGDRALADDLVTAIIDQSGAVADAEADSPIQVNPFDLAMYRVWADEEPEPGLTVEQVKGGSNAYVESRIIRRLRDDPLVTSALPMLASGGKYRVETIATALGCDPADLGQQLAAQEWVETPGGAPAEFVLASPAMAERLRRYFDVTSRQGDFTWAMRHFAEVLLPRLGADPLASIGQDELVTALRWAEQPADAARLWDSIASRAAEPPGAWSTVGAMTDRILGEWAEGEWPTTGALRAAVLAAHIAAYRRREEPQAEVVRDLWARVIGAAGGHPDQVRQRELRFLGALGSLPYAYQDASMWDVLTAEQGSLTSSPEVGTAAIDAMHRLLEAGHDDDARQLREMFDVESFRQSLKRGDPSRSVAWLHVAEARLLASSRTPNDKQGNALENLEVAERLAAAAVEPDRLWPYWIPPQNLLARIRIERGLIVPPAELRVLDEWEDYAARHLDSVDGERLASLCLRLRLRHSAVATAVAQRWESAERYLPSRVATDSAHDLVPPLFVSVAEAWLSAGQPARGLSLLEQRRSEANTARKDDATVRYADAAIVGLTRRLRLTDRRSLLERVTDPDRYRSEASRVWISVLDDARRAWAVIYREPPPESSADVDRLSGWHAWWQCQPEGMPEPVPPLPWSPESPDGDLADLADIQADIEEMRLLQRRDIDQVCWQLDTRLGPPEKMTLLQSVWSARSANPYRALRLDLRWAAMSPMLYTPRSRAPVRLIAEIAFGEAELLALRLPAVAARIFRVAADAYAKCGDEIGRLLALAAFHRALSECPDADQNSLLDALSTSHTVALTALRDARDAVRRDHPELAGALSGTTEDGDPWRYWAQTVQRHAADPDTQAANQGASPSRSEAPAGTTRYPSGITAVTRALPGVFAIAVAAVLLGGIRDVFRLAAERGVGVARVEDLVFEATISEAAVSGPDGDVLLSVGPRPWSSATRRAWSQLRLRAIILAAWLVRSGWPGRPAGYSGSLVAGAGIPDSGSIVWTPKLDAPASAWWGRSPRAAATGVIRVSRGQVARPWERILTASLSPAAAGRIEWVRARTGEIVQDAAVAGAELIASAAWSRLLGEHYRRVTPAAGLHARVRHVIGRAVETSAGPCIDVSGDSGAGTARRETLREVTDLTRGRPVVVVLQAEPLGEEDSGTGRHYDLEDKLRLAMALTDDGVPAVLILPELPASLAREVARTVTAFAAAPGLSGNDVQATLLRPLRTVLMRHVEPTVLDDIILFLNARYA